MNHTDLLIYSIYLRSRLLFYFMSQKPAERDKSGTSSKRNSVYFMGSLPTCTVQSTSTNLTRCLALYVVKSYMRFETFFLTV